MPKRINGEGKTYSFLYGLVGHQGDECVKWPFYTNPNGYGQVGWHRKLTYPHRVMCELTHGTAPEGHEAAHSCGNGNQGCVNPKHLTWKTKSQNRLDALEHGTGVIKRTGRRGSLTEDQVNAIRALKGKEKQTVIAERFGISPPRVRAIFTGKIYNKTSSFAS